ncbi:MAG: hypothetical protein M3128_00970, partial [Verrucomicrobiota bacterium]|nr:hypothetical protein [Verrucomicrobiota bacterium]
MKNRSCAAAVLVLLCSIIANADAARPAGAPAKALPVKRSNALDDSSRTSPASDLALSNPSLRKADALALFVEGARLEESGEVDAALVAYQKVLTVDPGEIE